MKRETIKQRRARVALLLARYDEVNRAHSKMTRELEELKKEVRALELGTYDEWSYGHGNPREITDMDAVRADFAERNLELPTKLSAPPIVVRHVGA